MLMAWESSEELPECLGPFTYVGDFEEASGSQLWASTTPAVVVI